MANLTGSALYQGNVRQIESTDPSHSATFNPINQVLINNDAFLKGRSDLAGLLGSGFIPIAGGVTFTRDSRNRILTEVYKDSANVTIATITVVYDDTHGGRINYIEAVIVGPPAMTIRKTYAYTGNQITGNQRTVS